MTRLLTRGELESACCELLKRVPRITDGEVRIDERKQPQLVLKARDRRNTRKLVNGSVPLPAPARDDCYDEVDIGRALTRAQLSCGIKHNFGLGNSK